jgi:TRAP-type C4-dicarboxylate transport system permease small subunit
MKFIFQITKGLIRDLQTRRMAMFVVLLIALVMLFGGATFFNGVLMEKPLLFISYWIVCGWLTFSAVLLALYDLIMLRVAARKERRKLKEKILGDETDERK